MPENACSTSTAHDVPCTIRVSYEFMPLLPTEADDYVMSMRYSCTMTDNNNPAFAARMVKSMHAHLPIHDYYLQLFAVA